MSRGPSDTSGAIHRGDEFGSIGYPYEHSEPGTIAQPPQQTAHCSYSSMKQQATNVTFEVSSPGDQTLASLKLESIHEKVSRPRGQRGLLWLPVKTEGSLLQREWRIRTFVSGPVDPRWYPYKVYCQICEANILIYGKGARPRDSKILLHREAPPQEPALAIRASG